MRKYAFVIKYMRCSNALVMREMQIKSKAGSYLMLVDWQKKTMSILPNVE